MAGSTSGNNVPASEAVQVLVSSLADESQLVRDASSSSLKDIASLNPALVLECSYNASRGGRRRFGNIAGAFQVISVAVGAINSSEVDSAFMLKLAKVATAEIISSKTGELTSPNPLDFASGSIVEEPSRITQIDRQLMIERITDEASRQTSHQYRRHE